MIDPLLSVTVTNYNYARFLEQTIESILAQTFTDFELVLIDNASTDGSVEMMHKYEQRDERVRVIEHAENLGMFASLAESCALSRGRYRVPIEADDWVLSGDAFAVQVELLEQHPSMAFVFPSMTMTGSDGKVFHVSHAFDGDVVVPGPLAVEVILSLGMTHTGMMMRVDALRKTRGYRPEFPHVADLALGVELCALGEVGYIDRSMYAFRQHETNLHLEPQLRTVRDEILPLIEEAFASPVGMMVPESHSVRKRVIRRALVHLPIQYVFTGKLRIGWRLYWESVKVRPISTIVQQATLALVGRTLLGDRGYRWLARRIGREVHDGT